MRALCCHLEAELARGSGAIEKLQALLRSVQEAEKLVSLAHCVSTHTLSGYAVVSPVWAHVFMPFPSYADWYAVFELLRDKSDASLPARTLLVRDLLKHAHYWTAREVCRTHALSAEVTEEVEAAWLTCQLLSDTAGASLGHPTPATLISALPSWQTQSRC